MENLTHTLTGIAIAEAGLRRRFGPGTTIALAVGANLPDIDSVFMLAQPWGVFLRRNVPHSLLGLPILALAAAWPLSVLWPRLGYARLAALFLISGSAHVLLDLVNSFGVVLLAPFVEDRYEFATIFIVDPILTALLAVPLLWSASRRLTPPGERAAAWSLVLAAAYLVLCGGLRHASSRLLEARAPGAAFAYVFPEPLGPHRWRGVARDGDVYRLFLIRPLSGSVEPAGEVRTHEGAPEAQPAREHWLGRRLDWFFKAPVWRVDGTLVEARDLRFHSLVLSGWRMDPFVFRFHSDRFGVEAFGWIR